MPTGLTFISVVSVETWIQPGQDGAGAMAMQQCDGCGVEFGHAHFSCSAMIDAPAAREDYDSPWKEAIEHAFEEFVAFYFPDAHSQIDWGRGDESLSSELRPIVQDATLGQRYADVAMRVWRMDGQEQWLCVHVEVQGTPDRQLPKRVYTYQYRLHDKHDVPVASFVVLADEDEYWYPEPYRQEVLGVVLEYRYRSVKLLDYTDRQDELEAGDNPFALMTVAHLKTRATRKDEAARYAAQFGLMRRLLRRDWDKQRIVDFLTVVDWLMHLPEGLERKLWQEIGNTQEGGSTVPYELSIVRIARQDGRMLGRQEGRQEGWQEGEAASLRRLLQRRFGTLSAVVEERIAAAETGQIEQWLDRLLDAQTLEEVFEPAQH